MHFGVLTALIIVKAILYKDVCIPDNKILMYHTAIYVLPILAKVHVLNDSFGVVYD